MYQQLWEDLKENLRLNVDIGYDEHLHFMGDERRRGKFEACEEILGIMEFWENKVFCISKECENNE